MKPVLTTSSREVCYRHHMPGSMVLLVLVHAVANIYHCPGSAKFCKTSLGFSVPSFLSQDSFRQDRSQHTKDVYLLYFARFYCFVYVECFQTECTRSAKILSHCDLCQTLARWLSHLFCKTTQCPLYSYYSFHIWSEHLYKLYILFECQKVNCYLLRLSDWQFFGVDMKVPIHSIFCLAISHDLFVS